MRRELARWVAMLFAVLGLACAAPEPPDTPVARVSARTADLALLLERLAQLEGTPLLFTGDTLFPGGPGNTSFDGGEFSAIIDSIDNKLFTFPANTILLPGHGVATTIGRERPHLQDWADRGW